MEKVEIKVRLLLVNKDNLLLLKQTSKNGGKYTLVGGKVEDGETPVEALLRESKEEAGIRLKPDDLELVHALHKIRGRQRRITLYFRSKNFKGVLKNREPEKFKTLAWYRLTDLPAKLSPSVKHVMKQALMRNQYSEF